MLSRVRTWITTDWALKATALALAFLLWTTVRADSPGQWEADDIVVRVRNADADWIVVDRPVPDTVTVVFRGPYRELLRAASQRPEIIVPIEVVNDSVETIELRRTWVRMPPGTEGTTVGEIRPGYVRVAFDRMGTRLLPVAVRTVGSPGPGFAQMGAIEVEPSVVRASGARRSLARVDSLRLPPIDLRDIRDQDTIELNIDTTGTGLIISPRTVRVVIPVRPLLSDSGPPIPLLRPAGG